MYNDQAQESVEADDTMNPEGQPSVRRVSLLIFLILFVCYSYFAHHPKGWNENSRLALAAAISRSFSFRIDKYVVSDGDYGPQPGRPVKEYKTGDMSRIPTQTPNGIEVHFYSDKSPGSSFLASIPYGLLYHLCRVTSHKVLRYGSLVFTVSLPSALFGVVMFLFLQHLRPDEMAWNAGLTLCYGLGTLAFPFSTLIMGHQLAAAAGFSAFYLIARKHGDVPSGNEVFWAGFLLSLTTLFEYTAGIVLIVVGAYALWTLRRKPALIAYLILGMLPSFTLQAFYNTTCYGKPWSTGYRYHVKYGSEMSEGFLGSHLPTWERFAGTLFMPKRGMFYEMPMLLLCVAGFYYWGKLRERRAEMIVCAAVFCGFVLFNSCFEYWDGVGSLGVRHVIPAFPFLMIGAMYIPTRWRSVFAGLAVVSIVYMLAGTAAGPRSDPGAADAVFGFALPLLAGGFYSNNLMLATGLFPSGPSVLFGFLSLVPLVLVARGLGLILERELGAKSWTRPFKRGVVAGFTAIVVFAGMLLASRIPVALRYHDMGNALYWESDKRGQAPAELITECFEKAVRLDPTNPEFHNSLGKRYWRTQRYEASLQEAIRAAELDPDNWPQVARVYYEMKRAAKAREALIRSVGIISDPSEIQEVLDDYDPQWSPPGWYRQWSEGD